MALSNYSELQTAIGAEIRRTDAKFTAAVPDLIARCEAKLNRRLRLIQQEQVSYTTYDATNTTRTLAFPSGFVELLSLRIKETAAEDTDYIQLRYMAPERFNRYLESQGRPERFTIKGQLILDRLAAVSYRIEMYYLKRWDIATDSTNWLLTNYPDAYLYGSLLEAELFTTNDERLPVWKSLFEEAITELNRLDERSRDDAELSTHEFDSRHSEYAYRVITDRY